jgi:phosphoenolpyruvate-protein kinase (PTS system EI component)
LGLDELSMNAANIPAVKSAIRQLTLEKARGAVASALVLESAEAVEDYLEDVSSE